uniref:AlNc14C11G1404 protein n=1 Tax=Albugo laibachii Nc14 TaxID=890382 RepID=F0W326_9STRA|nr:AlNc14C11G1404 [Albugo laibachii Nc14]|eukprot:CCA15463.1 AlNc14C11G1404 [Albugo laibachii Nc14]
MSRSISLLMDRNVMETMGYSVEAILQGAREKQAVWDASVDGATAVQTPVSKALQSCDKKLYEDLDDTVDEAKRCLFTPDVKHIEAQQDTINSILKEKVHEVQVAGAVM